MNVRLASGLAALALLATGCASDSGDATTTTPLTGNAAAGATVFSANCASCHGSDGAGTGTAPALTSALIQQKTDASLTATVTNGDGSMPAFGKSLSAQQIADVVAHVRTLGK